MSKYYDNHYAEMKVQPLEVMQEVFDVQEMCNICFSQVIKYHLRAGHKQGEAYEKDIAKRDRYLSWVEHLIRYETHIDANLEYPLNKEWKEFMLKKIDEKYKEMLSKKSKD